MNFNQLRNQGVLLSLVFIAFYLISSVVWYMNTDAPWDDDCVARYFNCLKAPENPANFVSLWNRPLFMVIFTYPYVWFGKSAILLMPLLSAISAWLLYKALDKIKVPHAWIVVPFLLMQSFYFVISGSALSEPLASFLIALGFYLLVNKRFLWFAVVGSLLPLARLELSLLLGIWGLILIVEKKLKYLPLLITGVVLWNTAAGIITGDWAFLYSATLGNGQDSNRYGHQTFGHYFQRLIYVVGPVVFYFLFGYCMYDNK